MWLEMKCVKCGKIWDRVETRDEGTEISGGLCSECAFEQVTFLYRRKQRAEGYPECFATAESYCDQEGCLYRDVCLSKRLTSDSMKRLMRHSGVRTASCGSTLR